MFRSMSSNAEVSVDLFGIHPYKRLTLSSILSIPKDMKSSLSSSDDYRRISLFNSICKDFAYVILDLGSYYFMTSDMKFGF